MGRPRKRRDSGKAHGASPTAPSAPTYAPITAQVEPAVAVPDIAMDIDPASLIDPGLADMTFLDFLGPDFDLSQPSQVPPTGPKDDPSHRDIWNFEINFDTHYPPPPADGSEQAAAEIPPRSDPSTPSVPSQGVSAPELAPLPSGSCGCLANLYLALDSLARLPTEVEAAIRVARGASKTAHDVIQCQTCFPPLTETLKVPIMALQNTMVLGALFPSVVDAYQRILDMIEAETARAICEHRQLRFSLPGYGGVWGRLGKTGRLCGMSARYADQWMQPAMWRLMVRALLKTDVYGINFASGKPGGGDQCSSHLGLKDIISQMDEKSRTRHAEIDAMVDAGLQAPRGPTGAAVRHSQAPGGVEPPCRKVLQIAWEAVDRLVIA